MLELGIEGKDKITGFSGILIARHQYITGCDQYTISCKMTEDGKLGDNYQFDEGRIEIIGQGINEKEVKSKKNGGPQHTARVIK